MTNKATFLICACVLLSGLFIGLMAHQWKPYPEPYKPEPYKPNPNSQVYTVVNSSTDRCYANEVGLSCMPRP